MNEIEVLNPILDKKYEEYQAYVRQREEARQLREALEAQMIYDSQQQIERQRINREQEEILWAMNPPSQDWSLHKELEGVVGVNAPQHSHRHQLQHQYHPHGTDGVQEVGVSL